MSELCKCGDGLSNLGVPSCKEGFDVAKRLIFVEQLDNDGTQNAIDVADVLDSTYLDGKFYNADKSQRWFITPDFDNVTDERADTETQTLDSGIELPLRQGQRTFTAFFQTLPASWGRKIGANACAKVGVYIVDTVGGVDSKSSVFVKADGTPQENGAALLAAYTEAAAKSLNTLGVYSATSGASFDIGSGGYIILGPINNLPSTVILNANYTATYGTTPAQTLVWRYVGQSGARSARRWADICRRPARHRSQPPGRGFPPGLVPAHRRTSTLRRRDAA